MANPFVKVREIIVGDSTAGDQTHQEVETSPTGDVIVTWLGGGTRTQVFDASGNEISPEITTLSRPAWLEDGSFVGFAFNGNTIEIHRHARDGSLLDSTTSFSTQFVAPREIVPLSSGNFAFIYVLSQSGDFHAQVYDAALDKVGNDTSLQITVFPTPQYRFDALGDGGFAAFRHSNQQSGELIRYNGTAGKVGTPITPGADDIAALADGGFIHVVTGGAGSHVVARIYNADGTVRVEDFTVSTTAGTSNANVAVLDDQLFVVTWGPTDMRAQLVHVSGRKIGSEILLDPGAGSGGWAETFAVAGTGWSMEALDPDTIVTASSIPGTGKDVELTYWDIDRANIRIGTGASESFDGGGAAERIMVGFGGDDTYHVDSSVDEVQEAAGEGTDRVITSVSFTIGAGQEIEILQTSNNIATSPLVLTGNALAQYIYGNYGANLIDGGGGGDTMLGFAGDDTYVVRNAADQVRENAGEGFDRINGTISYALAAGQEVEMLAFADNIGTEALNITGNEIGQYLYGNYGNNVLNGGGGADVMSGFLGDDTYFVDNSGDDVRENIAEGNDRIVTSASFALRAGQHVETIETSDAASTAAIDIAGSEAVQVISGNAGNNVLTGGGGADFLRGLAGDDIYFITPDATVQDFAGQGFDRVFVSGSYTLAGSEIEVLTVVDEFGTEQFNMTGNAFAQYVYGNDGANRIDGGGGGDVLVGRGGDDLLIVRHANDQIREEMNDGFDRAMASTNWQLNAGARVEMITTEDNLGTAPINLGGNEFAQYVYGNAGNNRLGGGAGKDVLNGLGGSDFFLFDTALNTAFTANFSGLPDTANVDRIDGFGADDRIALSGTQFGFTPGALPAGAFNLGTIATDADDRILWDAASRTLLFDPDGTGAQAAQMIAVLSDPFNLDASFIIVV